MKPSELEVVIPKLVEQRIATMIVGAPGVGKSQIIAQLAKRTNHDFFLFHIAISGPTDFKGLPFAINGQALFLPYGDLRRILEATKPTIAFFDDLGQAPYSVQAPCMQIFEARVIGEHKIPDVVSCIAATNRRQDSSGVQGILEAVKSRTVILELTPDLEDTCRYFGSIDMPVELIAFLRFRPELLFDFKPSKDMTNSSCPRTVEKVGKLIQMKFPPELEYEIFAGAAGKGFSSEFVSFLRVYRNLPNIDEVLANPDDYKVPTDISTVYALASALAHKVSEKTIENFMKIVNKMKPEFGIFMVRDAIARKKQLAKTTSFVQWSIKNSKVYVRT